MKKRAFVTGATGFIGTNLVRELVKRHYQVCCLVRSRSVADHLRHENIELVQGDLRDPQSLAGPIRNAQIVFHVAGVTRATSRRGYFEGNLTTTRALVETIRSQATSLEKIVYISSQAAGVPCAEHPGSNEVMPDSVPVSAYGQAKKKAEDEVLSLADRYGVAVLRPSIVYGPHDRGMLPLFKAVARGIRIKNGWRRFPVSLVYIDDLVEAIVLSAESDQADGRIFYVSDGRYYLWDDLNKAIADHVNPNSTKIPLPLRSFGWQAV